MVYISKYLYGLDLSITCTGIAIFNIDTYKPILITSVKTNSKNTHGDRLHKQNPCAIERWLYEFDFDNKVYVPIEIPESLRHIVNFGIG